MKNLFDYKILDDINEKINNLENSFVEISWLSYADECQKEPEFIGLSSNRRIFLKKCYTFSPL